VNIKVWLSGSEYKYKKHNFFYDSTSACGLPKGFFNAEKWKNSCGMFERPAASVRAILNLTECKLDYNGSTCLKVYVSAVTGQSA